MVDRDVIFQKISQIQNCLKRILDKTQGQSNSLDDIDVQDVFVLNLQRAIQSAIDLASHIVSDEGLGLPDELRENFSLLEKERILPAALSQRLKKMVGFRNIAVHEYEAISVKVLKSILKNRLKDLEDFYAAVLKFYRL